MGVDESGFAVSAGGKIGAFCQKIKMDGRNALKSVREKIYESKKTLDFPWEI